MHEKLKEAIDKFKEGRNILEISQKLGEIDLRGEMGRFSVSKMRINDAIETLQEIVNEQGKPPLFRK